MHADAVNKGTRNEKAAEQQASTTTGTKEQTSTTERQPLPAAPAVQQNTAPAQQPQSLTNKIAGFGVHPGLINALAQSSGDFGSGGFGADGQGQPQDMVSEGMMKPLTVDTLNRQSFANYMTAARSVQNPALQMVNVQLQHNINAKIDTMTLQLSPAELGRLDIRLKFGKDGGVKAHMTVEKPETLALLQKDSHFLERTLREAGLATDENSLSFDLRQQGQQHNLEGFDGRNKESAAEFADNMNGLAADNALQAKIAVLSYGYITPGGVNIMV
jgi:flagellar hook-length control protein FliK